MDNQRLILLLVFFFSLMMLWSNWQQYNQPQPVATAAAPAAAKSGPGAAAIDANVPTPAMKAAPGMQAPVGAAAIVHGGETMRVRTDMVEALISAQGGDIIELKLLHHHESGDAAKSFILLGSRHAYAAQSGLIGAGLPNHKSTWTLPTREMQLQDGQQELVVALEAPLANGGKVIKTYVFHRGGYLIDVRHEFVNAAAPPGAFAYYQLTRDSEGPDGGNQMMVTFTGAAIYTEEEKFRKVSFDDFGLKDAHVTEASNGWVAMVQHYFFTAWLPSGQREYFTRKLGGNLFAAGVITPYSSEPVRFYGGPQEQDKLDAIAPGLALVVDYGWLTLIAAPLFWVLEWINKFVGNWGWSIILLTILVKGLFFPLSAASYKSMAKMRLLTPKLMKLKEVYADDRQRMNQEMMELYKREKVNPLGGCLPIMVQIPVFIALYWVLMGTVEMRGAPWFGWITDLSVRDPWFVLPLLMGASMFVQTKLNPTPPDPLQAKIMLWMPVAMTVMFLFFPAGLVLYWTVNNLLSIAQQWQVNRMIERARKVH